MVLAMTLPSQAALPPQYQRQAELNAVLDVATDALGIERIIDAIELIEPDRYQVRTGNCTMVVRIISLPSKHGEVRVGPREFEARPEPLVCPPPA